MIPRLKVTLIVCALVIGLALSQINLWKDNKKIREYLFQREQGSFEQSLMSLSKEQREIGKELLGELQKYSTHALTRAQLQDEISCLVPATFFKNKVYSFISTLEKKYTNLFLDKNTCYKTTLLGLVEQIERSELEINIGI